MNWIACIQHAVILCHRSSDLGQGLFNFPSEWQKQLKTKYWVVTGSAIFHLPSWIKIACSESHNIIQHKIGNIMFSLISLKLSMAFISCLPDHPTPYTKAKKKHLVPLRCYLLPRFSVISWLLVKNSLSISLNKWNYALHFDTKHLCKWQKQGNEMKSIANYLAVLLCPLPIKWYSEGPQSVLTLCGRHGGRLIAWMLGKSTLLVRNKMQGACGDSLRFTGPPSVLLRHMCWF